MQSSRTVRRASLTVLIGLLATACQGLGALSDSDRAAIQRAGEAWVKAARANDHKALAEMYVEEAMLLPEHAPMVRGHAAIRQFFDGFPPFQHFDEQQLECAGHDGHAYVMGTYQMTLAAPGAPAPIHDRGKYIELWRKQADGSWKIVRDIYNSDLPPAGP